MIGAQGNKELKRQPEPTLLSGLGTEDNGKPLKCLKVCVLGRLLPGPATRLKDGKAGGKGADLKAVSKIQKKEKDRFVLG